MITPNSMKETIDRLNAELAAVKVENDKLRGILADGNDPCIYCGLPKADMGMCASGFPGCARADDLMMKEEIKE